MTPRVTALLVANAGMFLLQMLFDPVFSRYLAFYPPEVLIHPWTPFTYMFLHGGFMHILFNMWALYLFGPRVEERLGGSRFLGLYFASGMVGAILSFITPQAAVIGASGAVFGVFFAFAKFWPRAQIFIWGVLPVEARTLVIVATVLSLWFGYRGGGGVAHFAHLGGYLGAWLFLRFAERTSAAAAFKAKAAVVQPKRVDQQDVARWRRIQGANLHPVNREELDRILDKISSTGLDSLTTPERAVLERFSQTH
jgi:membrane associated rhomboid family serine protease